MTPEQKQAYEWAKNQSYNSVAARYAKLLAEAIDELGKQIQEMMSLQEYCDGCYWQTHGPFGKCFSCSREKTDNYCLYSSENG